MPSFANDNPALQVFSVTTASKQIFFSTGTYTDIYGNSVTVPAAFAANAVAITVTNVGTVTVDIMGGTATTNGIPLAPGAQLTWVSTPANPITTLHGITASGTTTVEVALVSAQSVM
jgi:hypothetical protein